MSSHPYHEQVDIMNTVKLRELMEGLPEYTRIYFRGIEPNTSSRTRIAYAYDLHVFFEYLIQKHPAFRGRQITELPVELLDEVKAVDIENYMEEYNSGDDSAYEQTTLKQFYEIKYGEVINAINFFKPDAVYSTDHGVKGEEYENVLFVMGRGWNLCKFEDSLYKDEKSLQGKELATYIRN